MRRAGLAALAAMLLAFPARGETDLPQVLGLALRHSPSVDAARLREVEAAQSVWVARSSYLPRIDFEAIDTAGFPGSSGLTGVGGLMGSAFRSGAAAGFVAWGNIWDFGRTTNAVRAAESDVNTRREDTRVTAYRVEQAALRALLDCARDRSQKESWTELSRDTALIATEVARYTKTGQRSVVERALAEAQREEAITAAADFAERESEEVRHLSILTGSPASELSCPLIAVVRTDALASVVGASPPTLARAQADAEAARWRVDRAKAERLPRIVGVASVGAMERSRVVDKQDYAAAIGLVWPLFDGLRTQGEIGRASAEAAAKERETDAARQDLDELNSRFDLARRSAQVRVSHLEGELALAREAFQTAKHRYMSFEGRLVDVRESVRNLARVQAQLDDARAELLFAIHGKTLANGAIAGLK